MKRLLLVLMLLWLAALAQPALATDTVYYYYTNTLRSAVVETDAQGNIVERTTYYAPYGQVLNRSLRDGPGYTGHEEDPATGLNYMQQRYYDPQSGRFVSTDPVLPTDGGENFNRYWYANDNPYKNIDPFGLDCRSAKGTTTCDIPVTGSLIPSKVSFPTPKGGLPSVLRSSAINEHHYFLPTQHNKPDHSVQQAMVNDPTPGSTDKPATPFGTYNEASPGGMRGALAVFSSAVFGGDPRSPVMSYSIKDANDNTWELNVTMPGHGLHFGYVLRGSVGGRAMSIGEGWAWKQMNIIPGAKFVDDVWNAQNQQNIDEAH